MKGMYPRVVKRVLDIFVVLLLSPVWLLLMIILGLIVKTTSMGPVFFKQKRAGIHNSYFNMLKFRTMRVDTPKDTPTHLLANPEQYITGVGRFLRKSSFDEIPQVLNIIVGHMSIIGPRPALWNQYDLIEEREKYGANDIRPGLSGWAQVNGRDELPIDVKARYDGEYCKDISFRFDLKILSLSISAVFKSKGVVEGGPVETGNESDGADL